MNDSLKADRPFESICTRRCLNIMSFDGLSNETRCGVRFALAWLPNAASVGKTPGALAVTVCIVCTMPVVVLRCV